MLSREISQHETVYLLSCQLPEPRRRILGTEEDDHSVPICTINAAPPLNSSPCNPAVLDFNEFSRHLGSLLKATVQRLTLTRSSEMPNREMENA